MLSVVSLLFPRVVRHTARVMLVVPSAHALAAVPPDLGPAWLAAGSALVGVLLTLVGTLLVARIQRTGLKDQSDAQLASQREQFREELVRERGKWRLELRRQAYVDFLVSAQGVTELIAPLSNIFFDPNIEPGELSEPWLGWLKAELKELSERHAEAFRHGQLVRLEGPSNMAAAAQQVLDAMVHLQNVATRRSSSMFEASAWVRPPVP